MTNTNCSSILESIFKNNTPLARLIVIQDCPSQAGLPILSQFIHQSAINSKLSQRQERVLLIKTTADSLLYSFQKIQANLAFDPSFQSIDLARLIHQQQESNIDLNHVLGLVRKAISTDSSPKSGKPLSILVDTVQELFRLFSTHETFQFLKNLLNLLPNAESRVIIIDSPHLNEEVTEENLTKILDASKGLRTTTLSASHIHLKIHPTSLMDHLINDFGLTLPKPNHSTTHLKPSGTHYDLRLFQLIHELSQSSGHHYPDKCSINNDGGFKIIPQALLISPPGLNSTSSSSIGGSSTTSATTTTCNHLVGSCVIEWTGKNLPCSFNSTCIKPNNNSKKNKSKNGTKMKSSTTTPISSSVHQYGLEALKLIRSNDHTLDISPPLPFYLTSVPISQVILKKSFKLSKPLVVDQNRSESTVDPIQQNELTFNLKLTEKQRKERERVELPFLPKRSKDGSVIEAPGEMYDGSFQKKPSLVNRPSSSGGLILYEPDSADDFDDDEPDED